jgi:hypothetical protein
MEPQVTPVEQLWTTPRAKFDALCHRLQAEKALGMTHSEVEDLLDVEGSEVLRLLYQDHLTLRTTLEVRLATPVVGTDSHERPRVRRQGRALETLFGTVQVERLGYGQRGTHSLFPLDGALNLPEERYSLKLRYRAALAAAASSFDLTVATVALTTAASVPKRQAEALAWRASVDFEAFYDARPERPDKPGALLVMSLDGKGIVMRVSELKADTAKKARSRKSKLEKRTSPGEKRNRKRMATVAAVYTVDPHARTAADIARPAKEGKRPAPPRPVGKRVWASVERETARVVAEMFEEAFRQDPLGLKPWVCVLDGNATQIRLVKQHAAAVGVKLVIVLDIIHVLEYLWKAVTAFHTASTPAAEAWVTERLERILKGESSRVAAGMRRSATCRALSKTARAAVDKCANYLLKLRDYLLYDQYLKAGYPIASGVIEGACRHLIADRLDITGARWSVKGAEAILKLRALVSSGDFEAYWAFHEARELERNHRSHYADNVIPFTRRDAAAVRVLSA